MPPVRSSTTSTINKMVSMAELFPGRDQPNLISALRSAAADEEQGNVVIDGAAICPLDVSDQLVEFGRTDTGQVDAVQPRRK